MLLRHAAAVGQFNGGRPVRLDGAAGESARLRGHALPPYPAHRAHKPALSRSRRCWPRTCLPPSKRWTVPSFLSVIPAQAWSSLPWHRCLHRSTGRSRKRSLVVIGDMMRSRFWSVVVPFAPLVAAPEPVRMPAETAAALGSTSWREATNPAYNLVCWASLRPGRARRTSEDR